MTPRAAASLGTNGKVVNHFQMFLSSGDESETLPNACFKHSNICFEPGVTGNISLSGKANEMFLR